MTYDNIRSQYAKNATQMAQMLASGKYRGITRTRLQECHDRATWLSAADDATLQHHFAECQVRVSSELAAMIEGRHAS